MDSYVSETAFLGQTARRIGGACGALARRPHAVHTIESAFPPLFGIPGAKLGLSNLFSMLALVVYGPLDALCILLARTLLGALIAGNASSLLFSLSGGGAALLVSILLLYFAVPRVSYLAVNIAAAVMHNIVQVAVFVWETSTLANFSLLPYFALVGVLSGAAVAAVGLLLFKRIPERIFYPDHKRSDPQRSDPSGGIS